MKFFKFFSYSVRNLSCAFPPTTSISGGRSSTRRHLMKMEMWNWILEILRNQETMTKKTHTQTYWHASSQTNVFIECGLNNEIQIQKKTGNNPNNYLVNDFLSLLFWHIDCAWTEKAMQTNVVAHIKSNVVKQRNKREKKPHQHRCHFGWGRARACTFYMFKRLIAMTPHNASETQHNILTF